MKSVMQVLLLALLFNAASLLAQNPLPGNSSLADVDSLLLGRKYSAARDRIASIDPASLTMEKESGAALIQEYSVLVDRLESVLGLPDSITSRYALAVSGLGERYAEVNAGPAAHRLFGEYATELQHSRISSAYERYTLAEFFLKRHVLKERQRLLSNLSRTRELVKMRNFDGAELLVNGFRKETMPNALVKLGDTLSGRYDDLAEAIRAGRATDVYEASRVTVAKHLYVGAGIGYNPGVSIKYTDLRFIYLITQSPAVFTRTDDAFKFPLLGLWVEAAYYITPSIQAGIVFSSSTTLQTNSDLFPSREQSNVYEARFTYQSMSLFLKYLLDHRTGLRPFVSVSGGYIRGKYDPTRYEGDFLLVPFGHDSGDFQVGAEGGVEFVPSIEFPACFSLSMGLRLNGARVSPLAGSVQVLLGVKAGFLF